MLSKNYLGMPLWVWIIIVLVISYSVYNCEMKREGFSESKQEIKVYNFNTSWCGWSKRFQPEWDEFMRQVSSDVSLRHIKAYDIKCDNSENESLCEKYNVPGYPYVLIENGQGSVPYNGERTAKALIETLINK